MAKRKASPEARGYGHDHRRLRRQLQQRIDLGGVRCARGCGRLIPPGDPNAWDLGHNDDDRRLYNGPECRRCNRATAGRRKPEPPNPSEDW